MHFVLIPLRKLLQMLFTQVSKPLAYRIALYAKRTPYFKTNFCLPLARLYSLSEKIHRKDSGKALTEQEALELGTTIMAEGLIFLVAAGIVINEYNRSRNKTYDLEEQRSTDIQSLRETVDELLKKVSEHETLIKNLRSKSDHKDTAN